MSLSTHIFVFAIGRGSAAFVRSGLKQGFILDMGGGGLFDPARFVVKRLVPGLDEYKKNTIAQAVLSHPHKDHIAQCGSLAKGKLYPTLLTCPTDHPDLASHEQVDWSRLGGGRSRQEGLDSYLQGPVRETQAADADDCL